MSEYLDLVDFWRIAEAVTGTRSERLALASRVVPPSIRRIDRVVAMYVTR